MSAIQAIFEKGVFRPTEPVELPEGSTVDVILPDVTDAVEAANPHAPAMPPARPPLFGSAKGMFTMAPDFDEPLEDFKAHM